MKKFFAIIMSVLMVACFMPTAAFAAGSATQGESSVASVTNADGTMYYDTLKAAVDAAKAGDTITLLDNLSDPTPVGFNAEAGSGYCIYDLTSKTLDLGGYTYSTVNFAHVFVGTNGVIKNGKMKSVSATDSNKSGSYALFIGDDEPETKSFTVDSVQMTGGVNIYQATGAVLKNSTFVGATNYYAVWLEGVAEATIQSGEYTSNGEKPVFACGGGKCELKVTGGTANSLGNEIFHNFASKEAVDKGATGTLAVSGGTFSVDPSTYVKDNGKNYIVKRNGSEGSYTYTVLPKANLTGGIYLSDPSGALASSYYVSDTNNNRGPWTVSYAGGSSSSSTTTTTTDTVTNTTEDKKTDTSADTGSATETTKVATTTATVKTETKTATDGTKTVAATVDNTTATKIVEKAVENKSEEVVIDTATTSSTGTTAVTETAAGTTTKVDLPEQTVKAIAEKTEAAVTIKSDAAEIKLDTEAVKAVAEQAGDTGTVNLVVETVAQNESKVEVDLKLVTSKGTVSDFKGGSVSVTVKLNTKLAAKPVVCVYIDDNGTYHKVKGVKNADGTYTFETGHFSTYAVMAEEEADKVIAEQTANVDKLISALTLKARSAKTAKGNIKVTLTADEDSIKAIEDLGYTVKYKFYRSTKKGANYKAKLEGTGKTYTNTAGKKGTKYYYKARVMVYDAQGELIAKTALNQCKYAARTK